MDAPRIAIVIVNWNGKRDTLECLDSITRIDYPDIDIIIVDNGSCDESIAAFKEAFPTTMVIETGRNLGFAGGNNIGIRKAIETGAKYVFLLNNDTTVDTAVLRRLREASQSINDAAILGAKIYYHSAPNSIWYAGANWDAQKAEFYHVGIGCADEDDCDTMMETDHVCGCALFAKVDIFREIGLFDERFFLTYEEPDLCYRARRRGYRSFVVPTAKVWHKVSTSFGGAESSLLHYFMTRNRLLWAEKHLSASQFFSLYRKAIGQLLRGYLPPRLDSYWLQPSSKSPGASFADQYREAVRSKHASPMVRAERRALIDFFLRRFGDCPKSLRCPPARLA